MTTRPSAIGVAGNVLLLILLLIMLPVGYWYHRMASDLWAKPESANVIPSEAAASTMADYLSLWTYMELAAPPAPGEERWPIFWAEDRPWSTDQFPAALADSVNTFLDRYAKQLQDPEDEFVDRPIAYDMRGKGFPYILYVQAKGRRDSLSYKGNLLPRDRYYSEFIPEQYDAFMHGSLRNYTLRSWIDMGVVEVTFLPSDTTVSPITLQPFSTPQVAEVDSTKLAKLISKAKTVGGPAGDYQIAVVSPGGSIMGAFFKVLAWILFALWFAAFVATIAMMSYIRRKARSIDAMLSGTETG